MRVFIQQMAIVVRYSITDDSLKSRNRNTNVITRLHSILIIKKSVIKIKCVFYKTKINLKVMKKGSMKGVEFYMHLCFFIKFERQFFRGSGTVKPLGQRKYVRGLHAARGPRVVQAWCRQFALASQRRNNLGGG
jgi:hypothetical protein